MKPLALSFLVAGAITLTGCSTLISLNPFVTDEQAVMDPALLGTWTNEDNADTYSITQDGAGYAISYTSGSSEPYQFKAHLTVAGDLKLLDLVSASEDPWQLQVHTPVRVWIDGNTLRVAVLESDWLKDQAREQLATVPADDRTLITAPGKAVRDFLVSAAADPEACDETEVFTRVQ